MLGYEKGLPLLAVESDARLIYVRYIDIALRCKMGSWT